jgi:hypothetical protein
LQPLHQGDKLHLFLWPLGLLALTQEQIIQLGFRQNIEIKKPVEYRGDDIAIRLQIFAHDLPPVAIVIGYSKEEVNQITSKVFQPVK